MPASMQVSMMRSASDRSELPTAANGPLPPKVMVPRVNVETFKPERPSVRYSMSVLAICLEKAPWRRREEARGFVGQFSWLVANYRYGSITYALINAPARACNKTVIAPL